MIGGKGANGKGLIESWKHALKGILRESRRVNRKYAVKQIARYTAEKTVVKRTVAESIGRYIFGTYINYRVKNFLNIRKRISFMNFIARVLCYMLIFFIVNAIFAYIINRNGKEILNSLDKDYIVVHLPNVVLWIGIIGSLIFSIFIVLDFFSDTINFLSDTKDCVWIYVGFSIAILLNLSLIFARVFWKVEIYRSKEYFIYTTFLNRKYTIEYKDCEYYKYKANTYIVKTKSKKLYIDNISANYEIFLAQLQKNGIKEMK